MSFNNKISFNPKHNYFLNNYFYFIFFKFFLNRQNKNKRVKFNFYSIYFFLEHATDYYVYKLATYLNLDVKLFWNLFLNFQKLGSKNFSSIKKKIIFFVNFFKNEVNYESSSYDLYMKQTFSNSTQLLGNLSLNFSNLNHFFIDGNRKFYLRDRRLFLLNLKNYFLLERSEIFRNLFYSSIQSNYIINSKSFYSDSIGRKSLVIDNHKIFSIPKRNVFRRFKIMKKSYAKGSVIFKKRKIKRRRFKNFIKMKRSVFKRYLPYLKRKFRKKFKKIKKKLIIFLKFFTLFLKFSTFSFKYYSKERLQSSFFKQRYLFYFLLVFKFFKQVLKYNLSDFSFYGVKGIKNIRKVKKLKKIRKIVRVNNSKFYIFIPNYFQNLLLNNINLYGDLLKNRSILANRPNLNSLNYYLMFNLSLFSFFKNNYLVYSQFNDHQIENSFNYLNLKNFNDKFKLFFIKFLSTLDSKIDKSLVNLYLYKSIFNFVYLNNFKNDKPLGLIYKNFNFNFNYKNVKPLDKIDLIKIKYNNLRSLYDLNTIKYLMFYVYNKSIFFKNFINFTLVSSKNILNSKSINKVLMSNKYKTSIYFYRFWFLRKIYNKKKAFKRFRSDFKY